MRQGRGQRGKTQEVRQRGNTEARQRGKESGGGGGGAKNPRWNNEEDIRGQAKRRTETRDETKNHSKTERRAENHDEAGTRTQRTAMRQRGG